MPKIERKYSEQQREALAVAYLDHGIRPAERVCELSEAGSLKLDGRQLEPFTSRPGTVRDAARKLRLRRAGGLHSDLLKAPPQDAVEALRRRLISLLDRELAALEKRARGKVNPETLRQLARVLKELLALPGPTEARPAKTAQTDANGSSRADASGGMAQSILRANGPAPRVQTREEATAQDASHHQHAHTEQGGDAQHARTEAGQGAGMEGPGEWARAQLQASAEHLEHGGATRT